MLIINKSEFDIINNIIQWLDVGKIINANINKKIDAKVSILEINKKLLFDLKGIFNPVKIVVKKDSKVSKKINNFFISNWLSVIQ